MEMGNVGQMEGLWYLKLGSGSMYGGRLGWGGDELQCHAEGFMFSKVVLHWVVLG